MRYLRRVGPLSTLLFAGVLGGLMVPLASEAGTPAAGTLSLTLQVDGLPATPASLLVTSGGTPAPGVCTAAEGTGTGGLGYTSCWNVNTSSTTFYGVAGRRYRMVRLSANTPGRFRVADRVGQDKMSLVGVKFEPEVTTWSPTQSVTLEIKQRNVFDAAANVSNATDLNDGSPGQYSWMVRSAGAFSAPSGQSAVGDSVTLTGVGTFRSTPNLPILSPAGSARNTQTLRFTVEGPEDDPGPLSFDGNTNGNLGQEVTYPRFDCIDETAPADTTKCRPDITLTMTVSLIGPDSYSVVGGHDCVSGNCVMTPEEIADLAKRTAFLTKLNNLLKKLDAIITRPTPRLTALIAKIDAFLNISNTPDPTCPGERAIEQEVLILQANDQIVFTQINAKPAEAAPPRYYAVIDSPGLTWEQARTAAQYLGGGTCDLATIKSGAEQAIINGLLPDPSGFGENTQDYWIGGKQVGAYPAEPGGNWQWIDEVGANYFWNSGPTGMYANWGSTLTCPTCAAPEPNNLGDENHLTVDNRYLWGWNDLNMGNTAVEGYIAEGPNPCTPPIID